MVQQSILRGNIHSIETMSAIDGPGLRTLVFMQGCPLKCLFCHNIDCTINGVGQQYTPEKLTKEILKNKEYWSRSNAEHSAESQVTQVISPTQNTDADQQQESCNKTISTGGVTFSGGEPLQQPSFLLKTIELLKAQSVNVWIDTCLHAHWGSVEALTKLVDGWIVSIKPIDHSVHEKYTGVSNELIHNNLFALDRALTRNTNAQLRIRFLVVPGLTDTPENLSGAIKLLKMMKNISQIELLKYADHGKYKWEQLFGGYKFEYANASDADLDKVEAELQILGVPLVR